MLSAGDGGILVADARGHSVCCGRACARRPRIEWLDRTDVQRLPPGGDRGEPFVFGEAPLRPDMHLEVGAMREKNLLEDETAPPTDGAAVSQQSSGIEAAANEGTSGGTGTPS